MLACANLVLPSFANDIIGSDPDKCDSDTLHVTAGTVLLRALWQCKVCERGTYLAEDSNECVACPPGYECLGGEQCLDTKKFECGRKLHIGRKGVTEGQYRDKYLCLYLDDGQPKTEKHLTVLIEGKKWLADLSTTPIAINDKYKNDSEHNKLKIKIDDVVYYVHDKTISAQ